MTTNFYDTRSERRVAAAIAEEHRAAAIERRAAAESARAAARVEIDARAAQLAEEAKERAEQRKAERRAARVAARRVRYAAVRAALPGGGMAALWASVIVAPLLLTWTAQTAFAVEQLGIPEQMAWLFPLAVETGAWVCAFEAHRRTQARRSAGLLPAWMWLLAGVAAAINFVHGLSTHGIAAGIALAALSVLGVLLHHIRQTLDRVHATGAPTAPGSARLARWLWHPWLSLRACSISARSGVTPEAAWEAARTAIVVIDLQRSQRGRA